MAYQSAGQVEPSLGVLAQGIKRKPDSIILRLALGAAYNKANKPEKAIEQFRYILDNINADNTEAILFLANTYTRGGDKKAGDLYKRAIQLDPNNGLAYNNLAWFYVEREENLDHSLILAQKANTLSPHTPWIIDTIGWIYLKMNKLEQAIKKLKQAAALDKNNPSIKYHLALAFHRYGENEKALTEINHILSNYSKFPEKEAAEQLLRELTK